MRNFVRRPQQVVAREVEAQLADAEPEPYVESPEEKALLDAYEASFSWSLLDALDYGTYDLYEDEFICDCPDCRMQDY